jgi:hypothetical protein
MIQLVEELGKLELQIEELRGYPIYSLELSNLLCSQIWGERGHHEGKGYVTPHRKLVRLARESGLFKKKEYYLVDMIEAIGFQKKWHQIRPVELFYHNFDDDKNSFDFCQMFAAFSGFYVQNVLGIDMGEPKYQFERMVDRKINSNLQKVLTAMIGTLYKINPDYFENIAKEHKKHNPASKKTGLEHKLDYRLLNAFAYTVYGNTLQDGPQSEQFRANILGLRYLEQHLHDEIDLSAVKLSKVANEVKNYLPSEEYSNSLCSQNYKSDFFFRLLGVVYVEPEFFEARFRKKHHDIEKRAILGVISRLYSLSLWKYHRLGI